MGIAEQTFYHWKKKYTGMGVAEVRKLRILEEENKKLKQLVAEKDRCFPITGLVPSINTYNLANTGNI
jgi:hypothetical protein